MEISELKIWRGDKARWSGEWGKKKTGRKEAISRVVRCQKGKGKKGLHRGYQLDAHMLPRVSSAD